MMPGTIRTDRLLLSRWRKEDAEALRATLDGCDSHLRPWIPFMKDEPRSLKSTRADLETRFVAFDRGEAFRYAIRGGADTALAGEVLLFARPGDPPGRLELGYWITPEAEGRGYVTEAARALVAQARERLDFEAIDLLCDVRNDRSQAVARRLGAEKIGEEAAPALVPGPEDSDVLGRWRLRR